MNVALNRRLAALEISAPSSFDHLSDEELAERLVFIWERICEHGLVLPEGWQEQCRADVIAFDRVHRSKLEALLCEA